MDNNIILYYSCFSLFESKYVSKLLHDYFAHRLSEGPTNFGSIQSTHLEHSNWRNTDKTSGKYFNTYCIVIEILLMRSFIWPLVYEHERHINFHLWPCRFILNCYLDLAGFNMFVCCHTYFTCIFVCVLVCFQGIIQCWQFV